MVSHSDVAVKRLETVKKAYRIPFISVRLLQLIRGRSGTAAVHIGGLLSIELRNLKGRRAVQLDIKSTVILRIPSSRPGPERICHFRVFLVRTHSETSLGG